MATAAEDYWTSEVWCDDKRASRPEKALYAAAWNDARPATSLLGVSILSRILTKQAWSGTPALPPWSAPPDGVPVVSFYSYKGGVGRTTALAAMAVAMARRGQRVAVVDLDLEAPGLRSVFAPPDGVAPPYGVTDYLLEGCAQGADKLDLSDYYYVADNRSVVGDGGQPIYVVPAGEVNGDYVEKLARLDLAELVPGRRTGQGGPDSVTALLRAIREGISPDWILLDSRSGLHDLGGLSLCGIAHIHVLLGLASEQSWQGLQLAVGHLGARRLAAGSHQAQCVMVHAMAPPSGPELEARAQEFRERSYDVFCESYYEEPARDADDEAAGVPDQEEPEAQHFPVLVRWNSQLHGWTRLEHVADSLTQGDYERLTARIGALAGVAEEGMESSD